MKSKQYSSDQTRVVASQVTASGSTTNGAFSVTIFNRGAATGTVAGIDLLAGEGWAFENNGPYDEIVYDATGTTFDVVEELE